ncbi:MAG: RNA polymerase sigma factor [Alphaproteobacteria bacterium]|nr:RNA polymerase sigma factor [Alphaproteobacteria bacterium]
MDKVERREGLTSRVDNNFDNDLEEVRPQLVRFALGLTRDPTAAEDLAQRAILRGLNNRGAFEAGTNLRAWLFTIARNCHIDDIRRDQRRGRSVELETVEDAGAQIPNQFENVELIELRQKLTELSETDREVLLMIAVEGMPYEEAAEILGVAVGTIKSRLSRARRRLRKLMGR